MIENVEDLSTKLDVHRLGKTKAFVEDKIELAEVGAAQRTSLQIAESPRRRSSKCCGVNKVSVIVQVGIDARDQVRSADVAGIASARCVHEADEPRRQSNTEQLADRA